MWNIYIITDEHGRLKIGIAVDLWRRLRRLQTGSADLLKLVCFFAIGPWKIARALETAVHERLRSHRVRGEWFKVSVRTAVRVIRQVATEMGVVVTKVPVVGPRPAKPAKTVIPAKSRRRRAA
jgi:hypothetical protein